MMPDGWTVSGVLAHMAFWDQRIFVLLQQWERGTTPREEHPADVAWINDSAKPMFLALPALARNAATPRLNFSRADHRGEHLDQIEEALR